MTNPQHDSSFDTARAELFEALGHPTRLKILTTLGDTPLSFSQLKRHLGIDSSGHMTFHLQKLSLLVRQTPDGNYTLTDEGCEALWLVSTITHQSPSGPFLFERPTHGRLIRTYGLVVLLIILFSISLGYHILQQQQLTHYQTAYEQLDAFVQSTFAIEDATLTKHVAFNGTASYISENGISGHSVQGFDIFNLVNDATLYLSIRVPDVPDGITLPLKVWWYESLHPSQAMNHYLQVSETLFPLPQLLSASVSTTSTFSVKLPSIGWYVIYLEGPHPMNVTTIHIPYTLTITMRQGTQNLTFLSLPHIIVST